MWKNGWKMPSKKAVGTNPPAQAGFSTFSEGLRSLVFQGFWRVFHKKTLYYYYYY